MAEVGGRHKGFGAVGLALGRVKTRGWIGVTGGQGGEGVRVRKPEQELRWWWEEEKGGTRVGWRVVGGENPRGRESTTQGSLWLRYGVFVLTLKWDLQRIASRKGFRLGNAIGYISNPL